MADRFWLYFISCTLPSLIAFGVERFLRKNMTTSVGMRQSQKRPRRQSGLQLKLELLQAEVYMVQREIEALKV